MRLLTRNDAPLEPTPSGLRRKTHARSDQIDLTEYFFNKGQASASSPHAHDFTTAVFVTSGEFELTFFKEGKTYIVAKGDSYVAQKGQAHRLVCLEEGSYLVAKPVSDDATGHASTHTGEPAIHGH